MEAVDFGVRVRLARERIGLTQEQLAEKLSTTQAAISGYENGIRRMYVTELPTLADALGVSISYFFEVEVDDYFGDVLIAELNKLSSDKAKETAVRLLRVFSEFAR